MNEDESIIAAQAKENEKISDKALLEMQKAFDELDKLSEEKLQSNSENEQKSSELEDKKDDEYKEDKENVDNYDKDDEEYELEKSEKKVHKIPIKENKYRKLQNDKYRALAEKEEALRKINELERLLSESLNSGTYHFEKSAHADLERAKQSKKIAIENGDIDALIEADIALTEAISAVNEVKKWNTQDQKNFKPVQQVQRQATYEREPEQNYSEIQQEIAQDWLDNHPYLQPHSKQYTPDFAEQVGQFINRLDDKLRRNNQMNLYFSEGYFDRIDEFINDNIKKPYSKNEKSIPSSSHIGGVRHGYAPSVNSNKSSTRTIELTAEEKVMCKDAGISEASWIKQKILEQSKVGN